MISEDIKIGPSLQQSFTPSFVLTAQEKHIPSPQAILSSKAIKSGGYA
jgi:hypothetical protein